MDLDDNGMHVFDSFLVDNEMTSIAAALAKIKERAEKANSMRSDDFGHDCDALLRAESDALHTLAGVDIPALISVIETLSEALEYVGCQSGPESVERHAEDALIKAEEILGGLK